MGPSSIAGIGTGRPEPAEKDGWRRDDEASTKHGSARTGARAGGDGRLADTWPASIRELVEIGRASCRERVFRAV